MSQQSLYSLAERLMEKKELRTRIGWVDWSTGSWDYQEAVRRAWRIVARTQGIRTNRAGVEL